MDRARAGRSGASATTSPGSPAAFDRKALVAIAPALHEFAGPTRIVWGTADRCFTLSTARRLADAFADARLIEVPDVSTFVPIDAPDAVAAAIVDVT